MPGSILRMLAGLFLFALGWTISFLMTTYVLPRDIILSLACYAASMVGLLITMYELSSLAVRRVGKRV